MYRNKKKKSWRRAHPGGPIKTRKSKADVGLTPGDVYEHEKEKPSGGLTVGEGIQTRNRMIWVVLL